MDLSAARAMVAAMPDAPVAPPPRPDWLTRQGKNLANLPENITEGLANTGYGLLNMGTPGPTERINVPKLFDIDQAQTTGEKIGDFFLGKGGAADIIGQSLAPMGLAGKLGAAAGLSEGPSVEALKWAAGFAGPEVQREDATGADVASAGLLGGIQGGLSVLPRKLRLLPSALLAGAHGLYEANQRDPLTGGVAALSDFVGGMLPGAHGEHLEAPVGQAHPSIEPTDVNTGLWHGPEDLPSPQSASQYTQYKIDLAQQEGLQAEAEAEQAATRGSLKEGVRLLNPNGLEGHVPTSDLLSSFEQTLPERGTAARLVYDRTPSVPREGDPNRFATLQIPEAQPELLSPPTIFQGVEPRPDVNLFGEPTPPSLLHPNAIFPVEDVGGGPRTPEDEAAIKKAMRKPTASKAKVKDIKPVIKLADGRNY